MALPFSLSSRNTGRTEIGSWMRLTGWNVHDINGSFPASEGASILPDSDSSLVSIPVLDFSWKCWYWTYIREDMFAFHPVWQCWSEIWTDWQNLFPTQVRFFFITDRHYRRCIIQIRIGSYDVNEESRRPVNTINIQRVITYSYTGSGRPILRYWDCYTDPSNHFLVFESTKRIICTCTTFN